MAHFIYNFISISFIYPFSICLTIVMENTSDAFVCLNCEMRKIISIMLVTSAIEGKP